MQFFLTKYVNDLLAWGGLLGNSTFWRTVKLAFCKSASTSTDALAVLFQEPPIDFVDRTLDAEGWLRLAQEPHLFDDVFIVDC
jgi:hypothetical protein